MPSAPALTLLHPSLSWAPPLFALRARLGPRWPGLLVEGTAGPVGARIAAALGAPGSAPASSRPAVLFDGVDSAARVTAYLRAREASPAAPLLVFHDVDDPAYAAVPAWEEERARLVGYGPDDVIPDAVQVAGDTAGAALSDRPCPPAATLFSGELTAVLGTLTRLEYDRGAQMARQLVG